MVAMLPADADALSAGAAEKRIHGPVNESKCKKKAPRKIHKAEREKHKRDLLNDLFGELGDMLEADRQNNGKACILTDTTRILRDLLSQLESLRKENSALLNESHYVTMERNELQDENGVLRNEILELQNALATRVAGNPGWDHGTAGAPLPVPHSASTDFPSQQPMQSPIIASAIFPALQQPAPPRELKLFPDAASDMEGPEPSEDQDAPNHVARPQGKVPHRVSRLASKPWPPKDGR